MKNAKAIIIVVVAVLLAAALVYLTLLIQDGSNPLGMFGIRASNSGDEIDPFLEENNVTVTPAGTTSVGTSEPSPTENLLAYNSTSPSPAPSSSATPSATLAVSGSPTPSLSFTPTPTEGNDPTPTTIQSLPVSGITDNVNKFLIGGGILILLGLLL